MIRTAILVDGGFYRRRAHSVWGDRTPEERADELENYCRKHLSRGQDKKITEQAELYRIFYYDCPPYNQNVYHPMLKKDVDYGKTELYRWMTDFLESLKKKRKMALRLGFLSSPSIHYDLDYKKLKKLLRKEITVDDLNEKDFTLSIIQKGVDMKIGVDIASLAYKKQVDRIILISDDSDFVPAAKLARREGIDFILDPMWSHVNPALFEHIDGLRSCFPNPYTDTSDSQTMLGEPDILDAYLETEEIDKNENAETFSSVDELMDDLMN